MEEARRFDRWFQIGKVILVLSPFVALMYLSMGATKIGGSVQQAISSEPKLTVMFLAAMVHPFIAYLLGFIQKRLEQGEMAYVVSNLCLLLVAELMTQNYVYLFYLGFLLFKIVKIYRLSILNSWIELKKNHFLLSISGSLVVICFSGICAFAMIRIGMI